MVSFRLIEQRNEIYSNAYEMMFSVPHKSLIKIFKKIQEYCNKLAYNETYLLIFPVK